MKVINIITKNKANIFIFFILVKDLNYTEIFFSTMAYNGWHLEKLGV